MTLTMSMQMAVAGIRLEGNTGKARVAWKETKSVPEVPSPLSYEGRGEQEIRLALSDYLLRNFAVTGRPTGSRPGRAIRPARKAATP